MTLQELKAHFMLLTNILLCDFNFWLTPGSKSSIYVIDKYTSLLFQQLDYSSETKSSFMLLTNLLLCYFNIFMTLQELKAPFM